MSYLFFSEYLVIIENQVLICKSRPLIFISFGCHRNKIYF